jgi:uncharacterized protein YkwD
MVKNVARPRTRAGAAALAAAMAVGLMVGTSTTAPSASALVMKSDRPDADSWQAKYNRRLLWLINNRREANGLIRLKPTACAQGYARRWSSHLTATDEFEHSDLGRLLDTCNAQYANENLAKIYDGARPVDLVHAWMNSPGHRGNILTSKARQSGVSIRWDDNLHAWVAVTNFVRK